MKKIYTLVIATLLAIFITGCFDAKATALKESAKKYVELYKNKEFVKLSAYTYPTAIEEVGGINRFINAMNSIPIIFKMMGIDYDYNLSIGDITDIVEVDKVLYGAVRYTQYIKYKGEDGDITSQFIGISTDNGETWTFIDGGTNEGLSMLPAKALQKLDLKDTTMSVGDKKMVNKSDRWITVQK